MRTVELKRLGATCLICCLKSLTLGLCNSDWRWLGANSTAPWWNPDSILRFANLFFDWVLQWFLIIMNLVGRAFLCTLCHEVVWFTLDRVFICLTIASLLDLLIKASFVLFCSFPITHYKQTLVHVLKFLGQDWCSPSLGGGKNVLTPWDSKLWLVCGSIL